MKIVTVEQMRALEKEANASGINNRQLMLKAGSELALSVLDLFDGSENQVALGLVGPGNNGGDTLVALTSLMDEGWSAIAYVIKSRPKEDEWLKSFEKKGGELIRAESDADFHLLKGWLEKAEVVLDGVLGIGVHLPLEKNIGEILYTVSQYSERPFTIAVDCPSGVDCDTGQVAAECIPADLTVCFGAVKSGLLKFPAFGFVGNLHEVLIGFSEDLPTWNQVRDQAVDAGMVRTWLPARPLESHKGSFGTALIVAGSRQYPGAVLLAGKAAYRMGVGLLQMAIPNSLQIMLAGHLPEATWLPLPEEDGSFSVDDIPYVQKYLENVNSILIGPGCGQSKSVFEFLKELLNLKDLPSLVIDADGLRHLEKISYWHKHLPKDCVLTPHPGEMSMLTGMDIASIQKDRTEVVRKYAVQWGQVVVLKGALTVVASPDGNVMIVPIATSALAHAGTGDVLAGMLASLIAQGMDSFEAAAAATWLHARAGQMAEEDLGTSASVLASDVIEQISQVISLLQ